MVNFFSNPSLKLKKTYQNNSYITYLNISGKVDMFLLYHKAMINIDLLQKSIIPALINKSQI